MFEEIEKKINKKTKDSNVLEVIRKVLKWEEQRIDMDKPVGAVEDFRFFIEKELEK